MALVSPGVEVTVIDQSSYPASSNGTVPLIFIATAQDKLVPGSTTTVAEGTLKANANKPYLLTSQNDAVNFFGSPVFQEDSGTVQQGNELNEWGLHALYSALGVTNQAWAVRADIDLQALQPTDVEPRDYAVNGTFWLNPGTSTWGLKEYNTLTKKWANQDLLVPSILEVSGTNNTDIVPLDSFGPVPVGAPIYAVVAFAFDASLTDESIITAPIKIKFFKKAVGESSWSDVTSIITYQALNAPQNPSNGDLWIKLDAPASGMNIEMKQFFGSTKTWGTVTVKAGVDVIDIESKWGSILAVNSLGFDASSGTIKRKDVLAPVQALAVDLSAFDGVASPAGDIVVRYSEPGLPFVSEDTVLTSTDTTTAQDVATALNNHKALVASFNNTNSTVDITSAFNREFSISGLAVSVVKPQATWVDLRYFSNQVEPSRVAVDNTLWYSDDLFMDFMITDGREWKCFASYFESAPGAHDGDQTWTIAQIEPDRVVSPASGVERLPLSGDVWVDPQDGANMLFYRHDGTQWVLLDHTDQSTTEGILFDELRGSNALGKGYLTLDNITAKEELRKGDNQAITGASNDWTANFVDPDAPDPRLYPAGMVCCNIRSCGSVVLEYNSNPFSEVSFADENGVVSPTGFTYINGTARYAMPSTVVLGSPVISPETFSRARWVSASGVALDGSGLFGRNAQRKLIVEALAESSLTDDIRSEFMEYNLVVTPGYCELLDELITLHTDRKGTCYIITDVPARLKPTGTEINNWAKNANNAPSNGDKGRTSAHPYAAQYMGWGLGTNVDGREVAIPGSTIALRTYIYSDSVSYVWYPPAGTQRGIVTNAASIGYINEEGEYAPVIYNQGQRDIMFTNNINPITMRPGKGLLVWGDKSLSPDASALDRVNVGRLIVYIRTELAKIAERFIFQLNTAQVREEAAGAVNAFLAGIVQQNGLYDYAVIADSSNNTPARINQNSLYLDVAIRPSKSISFVYIPIRILGTE